MVNFFRTNKRYIHTWKGFKTLLFSFKRPNAKRAERLCRGMCGSKERGRKFNKTVPESAATYSRTNNTYAVNLLSQAHFAYLVLVLQSSA